MCASLDDTYDKWEDVFSDEGACPFGYSADRFSTFDAWNGEHFALLGVCRSSRAVVDSLTSFSEVRLRSLWGERSTDRRVLELAADPRAGIGSRDVSKRETPTGCGAGRAGTKVVSSAPGQQEEPVVQHRRN